MEETQRQARRVVRNTPSSLIVWVVPANWVVYHTLLQCDRCPVIVYLANPNNSGWQPISSVMLTLPVIWDLPRLNVALLSEVILISTFSDPRGCCFVFQFDRLVITWIWHTNNFYFDALLNKAFDELRIEHADLLLPGPKFAFKLGSVTWVV